MGVCNDRGILRRDQKRIQMKRSEKNSEEKIKRKRR